MRCKHLHSKLKTTTERLLWRALISTAREHQSNCQTLRQVSNLATRSKKGKSTRSRVGISIVTQTLSMLASNNYFIDQVEHQLEQHEQKLISKKRIPVHISAQVNKQTTPTSIFTIHSHLQKGESDQAWKLFDKSSSQLTHIPRLTAHMLLTSLKAQVDTFSTTKLQLDFGKLQQYYFARLELLSGLVYKGSTKWDKGDFCTVIELYGQLGQIKRTESIFRNWHHYCNLKEPTIEIYNSLLSVYIRQFKYMDEFSKSRTLSKLKSLELELNKKKTPYTTTTYNMLIAAQIKSHNLQAAEKIFKSMTTRPDRTTYNILLNGYLKDYRTNQEKEITNHWMEQLLKSGMIPNKKTFVSVMDGLAEQVNRHAKLGEINDMKSTSQSIQNLYKAMVQLGHYPDTEIANTLLKCWTSSPLYQDEIDQVFGLLDLPMQQKQAKAGGGGCGNCGCIATTAATSTVVEKKVSKKNKKQQLVKPDNYTFNMLIRYYLTQHKEQKAFETYDLMMRSNLDPDTITYSEFIQYYANKGQVEESLKYFDVMQKKGIPTNNHIYNILLNCSTKYPEYAHTITPHLTSMVLNGNVTMDTVSKHILLLKNDNSLDEFIQLVDQHVYTNQHINTRTLNTILQSAGKYYKNSSKKEEDGGTAKLLDEMIQSLNIPNLRPDIYTYALNLRNAAYQGDMLQAQHIFKDLMASGHKPNSYIFSHLIYGYANVGNLDKAQEILQGMSCPPYNIIPTAINYAPLIKGYAENAEYDKAYALFRDMLDKDIHADLVIYTILARVFLDSGSDKRAIDLLEGIHKAGIEMDVASWTLLVEAYALQGTQKNATKINQVYEKLEKNNWLDAKSITTLLNAHKRIKNPQGAWKLWNQLKQQHTSLLSTFHYNALLNCLTTDAKAWFPIAKLVFEELQQIALLKPDAYTLDIMIWGAYSVNDFETVRQLWQGMQPDHRNGLLVKTYFAIMTAFTEQQQVVVEEEAKRVYLDYFKKLPHPPPNSTTVWADKIHNLAKNQGF